MLAHEIAHVTARHSVRKQSAVRGSQLPGIATILTTGSYALADIGQLWSSAAVQGYGREMN